MVAMLQRELEPFILFPHASHIHRFYLWQNVGAFADKITGVCDEQLSEAGAWSCCIDGRLLSTW